MFEIASVDGQGGFVEVMHRLGDGLIEAHGGEEGEEFEHAKGDGHGNQHLAHQVADAQRSDEQPPVEQRGPRGHIGIGAEGFAIAPVGGGQGGDKADGHIVEMQRGGERSADDRVFAGGLDVLSVDLDIRIAGPPLGCELHFAVCRRIFFGKIDFGIDSDASQPLREGLHVFFPDGHAGDHHRRVTVQFLDVGGPQPELAAIEHDAAK